MIVFEGVQGGTTGQKVKGSLRFKSNSSHHQNYYLIMPDETPAVVVADRNKYY